MSKTRQRTHSEMEHLRGEVKKLKSQLRYWKRKAKALQKKEHFFDSLVDEMHPLDDESQETCTHCGKGTLSILDLTYVQYKVCDICEYKEKIKTKKRS